MRIVGFAFSIVSSSEILAGSATFQAASSARSRANSFLKPSRPARSETASPFVSQVQMRLRASVDR